MMCLFTISYSIEHLYHPFEVFFIFFYFFIIFIGFIYHWGLGEILMRAFHFLGYFC